MTVDYERWSFTRESNYRALTGKNLVFFICGRLREVDSYEKWSYLEFQVNPNLKNEGKRGAYGSGHTTAALPCGQLPLIQGMSRKWT